MDVILTLPQNERRRMAVKQRWKRFLHDTRADAVVEATILFPVIIMIFTGLALLSVYLPERAALQRATQFAATAISTEQSDTWLDYNDREARYSWETNKDNLPNVYVALLSAITGKTDPTGAERTVKRIEEGRVTAVTGELSVYMELKNFIIYKEVTVTATRTVKAPVDLSLIGFPAEIPITVSSKAIVENGDEFVRTMDMAEDFVDYIAKKYGIELDKISEAINKVWTFLGVN